MDRNPSERTAETNCGRSSRRTLILIILIVLGAIVFALGFRERWIIGATCPKCLQGASITVVKIAGIPVFKWTTYSQRVYVPPSWSDRTASAPGDIHPRMYTEILGKECSHELKRGEFGVACSFFFLQHVHKDGVFLEGRLYQPRIEAIAALYCAFKNVPDKSLARMTYVKIDAGLPMNNERRLREVYQIQKMRKSATISGREIQGVYPAAFPMYQAAEAIKAFTVRLSNVASREEWVNLLNDLDTRLQMQSPTE